jgi:hypothetical protein
VGVDRHQISLHRPCHLRLASTDELQLLAGPRDGTPHAIRRLLLQRPVEIADRDEACASIESKTLPLHAIGPVRRLLRFR